MKYFGLFLFLLHTLILGSSFSERVIFDDLVICEATLKDDSGCIADSLGDSLFLPYTKRLLPHTDNDSTRVYILKQSFVIPKSLQNRQLFFYSPPSVYPVEQYINGHLVALSGRYRDKYVSMQSYATMFVVPFPFLQDTNELVIRIVPRGERVHLKESYIGAYEDVSEAVFWQTFFNYTAITGFGLLSFIYGVLFLLLWFSGTREDNRNLFFATTTFSVILLFSVTMFGFPGVNELILWKLSRIGAHGTALFLMLTMAEIKGKAQRKMYFLIFLILFIVALFISISPSKYVIALLFSYTTKLIIIPALLCSLFCAFQNYYKKRSKRNTLLLAGFLLFLIATGHDMYCDAAHVQPYCWWIPYGYIALETAFAIVLAFQHSELIKTIRLQHLSLEKAHHEKLSVERVLNQQLERRINHRTEELLKMQEELLQNAHKAGMAEVASNVLHNVGNILTSVLTSTDIVTRLISKKTYLKLEQANTLLENNESGESQEKVVSYYVLVTSILKEESDELQYHTKRLADKVHIIADVISSQQAYTSEAYQLQLCSVTEVARDALIVTENDLYNSRITITNDLKATPELLVNRLELLQVFINIIKNSIEAMVETPADERKIYLTTSALQNKVVVLIRDSGCGIPIKKIDKIFEHGYTTKKNGHGLGLHGSYIAIKNMGGEIHVKSEGIGKGVTFTLEFPVTLSK